MLLARASAKLTPVRIFGIALALVLFAIPFEYCMDGLGFGFPFAWYHPGHDDWGAYVIDPDDYLSDVIDFVNIAASLAVWLIVYSSVSWYSKRNSSQQKS